VNGGQSADHLAAGLRRSMVLAAPLVLDEEAAIRVHGGTACDRVDSDRGQTHGHARAVKMVLLGLQSTKASQSSFCRCRAHRNYSNWWSGRCRTNRPSAFRGKYGGPLGRGRATVPRRSKMSYFGARNRGVSPPRLPASFASRDPRWDQRTKALPGLRNPFFFYQTNTDNRQQRVRVTY